MTNTTPKPPETIGDAPQKSTLLQALEDLRDGYPKSITTWDDRHAALQKHATDQKRAATQIFLSLYENAAMGKLSVQEQDAAGIEAISQFVKTVQAWVDSGCKGRLFLRQETENLVREAGFPVFEYNRAATKTSRRNFLGKALGLSAGVAVGASTGGIALGNYLNSKTPHSFTPEDIGLLKDTIKSKLALVDDPNAFAPERISDTMNRLEQLALRERRVMQTIRDGEPSSPIIKSSGIAIGIIGALAGVAAISDAKKAPAPQEMAETTNKLRSAIDALVFLLDHPDVKRHFQNTPGTSR